MKSLHLLRSIASIWTLLSSFCALAQVDVNTAHEQGLGLAQSELDRVGTSNINQNNADTLVPFAKAQPIQRNESRTDGNLFFDMGVGQINSSRNYTAGNCDREGFNPEAEARKGVGESKWGRMTPAQRTEAISNQRKFFDQECDGINFLAGSYPGRTQYEIQPDDDLGQWAPETLPPDVPGACTSKTISTPPTYDNYYCNESTAVEKRQCHRTANVWATFTDALPDAPYTQTIYNSNSPQWTLTVYPSQGLISVYAENAYIRTEIRDKCVREVINEWGVPFCAEPWGITTENRYEHIPVYGPQTEVISMYGGQTSIWQAFFEFERFRVRSRPVDACVFRIDNWHYEGGAGWGPEDNHMTWTYNFCLPVRSVNVTWSDNCGTLEAATRR